MKSNTLFLAAILFLGLAAPPCVLASEPVVTVLIAQANGTMAFGSGFVSSPNGDVITCYHVVEGASKISVFYKKLMYDAQVVEIAPDRDIAQLRMNGVPLPTQFFRLRYDLPPNLTAKPLLVEGYAAGLFDQSIEAHATQNTFALSEQMSDQQGNRLFRVTGVKVLPLTLVIYKGLSGAPLLTPQGEVIGVISGSLTQGGSIAWAIAAENIQPRFASVVNTAASSVHWPKLALMPDNWPNLRSQTGIGQDLVTSIDAFTKAIDEVQSDLQAECTSDNVVVQGLSNLVATFDRYPALANIPMDTSAAQALRQSASPQLDVISPQMTTAESQLQATIAAVTQADTKVRDLSAAAADFQRNLPRSKTNTRITSQLAAQSSTRDVTLRSFLQEFHEGIEQVHQLLSKPRGPLRTVSDYRAEYQRQLDAWKLYQHAYCVAVPPIYSGFRDQAVDYRLLLSADLFAPK